MESIDLFSHNIDLGIYEYLFDQLIFNPIISLIDKHLIL